MYRWVGRSRQWHTYTQPTHPLNPTNPTPHKPTHPARRPTPSPPAPRPHPPPPPPPAPARVTTLMMGARPVLYGGVVWLSLGSGRVDRHTTTRHTHKPTETRPPRTFKPPPPSGSVAGGSRRFQLKHCPMLRLNSGLSSCGGTPRSIHPPSKPPSVLTAAAAVGAADACFRPIVLLLVERWWWGRRKSRGCWGWGRGRSMREDARSHRLMIVVVMRRAPIHTVDARASKRSRVRAGRMQ